MTRLNGRALVIAAVVVLFILAGGFVVLRGSGGGGGATRIDLRVTGTTMNPESPSAHLNDTVTMTITTDRDEEVHLHGYDIAFACRAGQPLAKTFRADKTGQFAMEIESTSTELGTFTVSP